MPQSLIFIANILCIHDAESFELEPGYILRKASKEEIAILKEHYKLLTPFPQLLYDELWEGELPQNRFPQTILPEDNWRYYVVAFDKRNEYYEYLTTAFLLSPKELENLFTLNYQKEFDKWGIQWNREGLFQVLQEILTKPNYFSEVNVADIEMIKSISTQFKDHGNKEPILKDIIQQIHVLKGISIKSPLKYLGYFGLLESLLTHAPKLTDPYDSIGRQIRKKIALIDNRMSNKIDYSSFKGMNPETIWTKMYSFRSKLAHGDPVDFSSNEFKALVNYETALKLLKETVKAVTRQALKEPTLLVDLKDC